MQTLSATEVKRRGIIAVEELLPIGPVHIIKNNHLACVVLSEEEYEILLKLKQKHKPLSLSDLLKKPATGKSNTSEAQAHLKSERGDWD